MNISAINHRCAFTDCYAYNKDSLEINIKTGLDITEVFLVWEDPYNFRLKDQKNSFKGKIQMEKKFTLKNNIIWNANVEPPFKRLLYHFEIFAGTETICYFENDYCSKSDYTQETESFYQDFKMAWMNQNDIPRAPEWVKKTVWYQIMPERFCSKGTHHKRLLNKTWGDEACMKYSDFFGGDLKGIIEKLNYLKNLGISGIYLTPIFKSSSNHKYNTEDYYQIDPDFGCEEDMITLVEKAHSLGIRIMLDGVFNHSGTSFPQWQDVLKNKEKSKFKDWFFVNDFSDLEKPFDTSDGRYFSFDFVREMPKLNTNNPEVQNYFIKLTQHWVKDWKIDGIRFDVANEVSHDFIKNLKKSLLPLNNELFLLGEIWVDSIQWLTGDEYDSVMNYPFQNALNGFFNNPKADAKSLESGFNKVYSLYYRQTNSILFNFIDTHDTPRAINSFKSRDDFFQALTMLLTMQGTPCLYYGTEIALDGKDGPYNRRCMPWEKIENGDYEETFKEVKALIFARNQNNLYSAEKLEFIFEENSRFVHYVRTTPEGEKFHVYINASPETEKIQKSGISIFERNCTRNDETLLINAGGIYIEKQNILTIPNELEVNDKVYKIKKLLGKGKGGYSYLAEKDGTLFVLKQIHHEPCEYYNFGNKTEAEKKDYERLSNSGIKIPKLYEIDEKHERILKEFVDGKTIVEHVKTDSMKDCYYKQIQEMSKTLRACNLNIDYYPTNFIVQNDILFYIDYECNNFMEEWSFENWGISYWKNTPDFQKAFN